MISTVPQFNHSSNSHCERYAVQGNHSPQFPSTVANCGGKNAATQQITVHNEKKTGLWMRLTERAAKPQSNSPTAAQTNSRATSQSQFGQRGQP